MKTLIPAISLLAVLLIPTWGAAQEKRILNIAAYHPEYAWTAACVKGIETTMGPQHAVDNYFMDTKQISPSKFQEAAQKAWEKYNTSKPDLVMLGDDNALKLLGPQFATTKTPIVYYGINNNPRLYFESSPKNITGVLERPLLVKGVVLFRKIVPNLSKVLVLFDGSTSAQAIVDVVFQKKETLKIGPTIVEPKHITSWDTWKKTILHAKEHYDAIMISNYFTIKDEKGENVNYKEIITWTSRNTPVVLFAFQEFAVHAEGAVGAYVVTGEQHGSEAAKIALRILDGESPRKIFPATDKGGKFFFNQQQLERFGLTLPANIQAKATFQ